MEKTQVVSVRLTDKEKKIAESIANYLHVVGKIEQPTISEALRACLYFTFNEIVKAIEYERLTGEAYERRDRS